jgi:hypothetical protein
MPVPASELDFDHTCDASDAPIPMMYWTCVNAMALDGLPFQCRIEFRSEDTCVGVVEMSQSGVIKLGDRVRFVR